MKLYKVQIWPRGEGQERAKVIPFVGVQLYVSFAPFVTAIILSFISVLLEI